MPFTTQQYHAIASSARASSCLSICGIFFVLVTFLTRPAFNKPINRLIFYASWGNLCAVTATFITRSAIEAGPNSSLCQFQGFLINWFHAADAYWTLAMAVNVYLVFFRRYTTDMLRGLERRYLLACYGLQIVPSVVYLFVKTKKKGRIYGDATIWCWIQPKWNPLRMATFYGPVWICGCLTGAIYLAVGLKIMRGRNQLRLFRKSSHGPQPISQSKPRGLLTTREVVIEFSNTAALSRAEKATGEELQTFLSENALERPTMVVTCESNQAALINDAVAMAYSRFACLYFCSMLITWTAPSINRTYGLLHPTKPKFSLNYATALLLPLQGFWNSVVYVFASIPACKAIVKDLKLWAAHRFSRPDRRNGLSSVHS